MWEVFKNFLTELSTGSGDNEQSCFFDSLRICQQKMGRIMPIVIAGAALAGFVLAFLLFALPARRLAKSHTEDLKSAQSLLEEAQKDREQLKQQLADSQYQLKETEKDLAFIKTQSN